MVVPTHTKIVVKHGEEKKILVLEEKKAGYPMTFIWKYKQKIAVL